MSEQSERIFHEIIKNRRTGNLYPHPDDGSGVSYPILWEFLTRTEVDDEHTKEPAKLTISLSVGGFALEIVDPSLGFMVSCTTERLSEAFSAIEEVLRSPNPPIRYFRDSEIKLKRKPKKGS